MMEEHGLVSILIPMYNHERYVVDCLESVKAQTYNRIEVLICDDCSVDNSYLVAKAWCDQNKGCFANCLVMENETNLGVTKNLNRLLQYAKGEYVKLLASDDMLMENGISDLVKVMEDYNYEFVHANAVRVTEKATFPLKKKQMKGNVYHHVPDGGKHLLDTLYERNFITANTVLLRKNVFEKYGFFSEEATYEDWEYWLRIASRGGKLGTSNMVVAAYRETNISASHFLRTEAEKRRFMVIIQELEQMLISYSKYTDKNMDGFWNNTLSTALRQHNDEVIQLVMEKAKRIKLTQRVKLLLYKLHLYDFAYGLFGTK